MILTLRGLQMAKKMKMPVESPAASTAPQNIIARRSADEEKREREYRARSALEDIERAEKHKSDRSLMKDVKRMGKEKIKALNKIC